MIEQRVTLRYGAQQIPAIVQAVQGDTGRDVIFELADYEIPAGATANYYIDKPDGNAVYNSAEVISSTEILAHLTEQAIAAPGRNNGQVRILADGEVITSFDFVLEVMAFRGILHMQSETEINIFDQAIEDAVAEIQAQTPVVTGMQNSIAPTYSSSSTYAVGDYVMYNAQLYRCITAISTAEAWTAAHWIHVPIAPEVSDLKSALDSNAMSFLHENCAEIVPLLHPIIRTSEGVTFTPQKNGISFVATGTPSADFQYAIFPTGSIADTPFFPGANYIVKYTAPANAYLQIICNGNVLINVQAFDGEKVITIPSGTTTIKVNLYCLSSSTPGTYTVSIVNERELDYVDIETQTRITRLEENTILSSNRLNMATLSGLYILSTGIEQASASYKTTDFVPVTAGETIYFWGKNSSGLFNQMTYRFIAAYDNTKAFVSASYVEWVEKKYTVPSGVSYIRLGNANASWTDNTDIYIGADQINNASDYKEYGKRTLVNAAQVQTNKRDIDNITKESTNRLDVSRLIAFYTTKDGVLHYDTGFRTTDFIKVTSGEVLHGWGKNNGIYTTMTLRMVAAYDENKGILSSAGTNDSAMEYTVPSDVEYVRITLVNSELSTYSNAYIGTHNTGVNYEPFGAVLDLTGGIESEYIIHNGDSILAAVKHCYANGIKTLIVESGSYDIISEYESYYGSDYFTNYTDYSQDNFDAGIWLQNITVKFAPGAKVTCKYTGNNSNVQNYFCAFATGNNVEIDGLILDSENLRYGIHSDFNTGSDNTYFIVRNSDIKHVRFDGNKCIGAGLGQHVSWLFENCIFRTTGDYYAVRIHNNFSSVAQSKIIVKDCYIVGDGYFLFTSYGTSQSDTIVQVCGCSYKTAPKVQRETEQSNDNITLVAWNNEIRT